MKWNLILPILMGFTGMTLMSSTTPYLIQGEEETAVSPRQGDFSIEEDTSFTPDRCYMFTIKNNTQYPVWNITISSVLYDQENRTVSMDSTAIVNSDYLLPKEKTTFYLDYHFHDKIDKTLYHYSMNVVSYQYMNKTSAYSTTDEREFTIENISLDRTYSGNDSTQYKVSLDIINHSDNWFVFLPQGKVSIGKTTYDASINYDVYLEKKQKGSFSFMVETQDTLTEQDFSTATIDFTAMKAKERPSWVTFFLRFFLTLIFIILSIQVVIPLVFLLIYLIVHKRKKA